MKLATTLRDIAKSKALCTYKIFNSLPKHIKSRLAIAGAVVGGLGAASVINSWRLDRHRGEMTRDMYERFLREKGFVQNLHANRKKSHLMGDNLQRDQMSRLFDTGAR